MVAEEIRKLADDSPRRPVRSAIMLRTLPHRRRTVDSASQAQAMVELQTKAVDEVMGRP